MSKSFLTKWRNLRADQRKNWLTIWIYDPFHAQLEKGYITQEEGVKCNLVTPLKQPAKAQLICLLDGQICKHEISLPSSLNLGKEVTVF